ncbi:hypothetical protein RND71_037092 [Anisodus tanguticus]|uniref:Uncharacterized protein n=1 Tax=Anisodus tanguticus TaxID=243964 RepID=A0AAE1R334_9SOLA|nr:hypothetical protein RND71_037092 [Anisodus tanguticus]
MELKFRNRYYKAEEDVHSLPRVAAETHPLSVQSTSCGDQVDVTDYGGDKFFDPLRGNYGKPEDSMKDFGSTATEITSEPYKDVAIQFPGKEWTSYKKVLVQKFPVSKMISVSSLSSSIMKTCKGEKNVKTMGPEKSSANVHLEELDDPQRFAEEGVKYITLQEYVSHLTELKDEISRAWHANDRVTSLNLSIKVAKLLSDTSVLQLYPTLFVIATEILDMLGDMITFKQLKSVLKPKKPAITGFPKLVPSANYCHTCENSVQAGDYHGIAMVNFKLSRTHCHLVCLCNAFITIIKVKLIPPSPLDWDDLKFSMIIPPLVFVVSCSYSISAEQLPEAVKNSKLLLWQEYLELAIYHCWRFLLEQPADNLPRLVMMARGIADPLASFYCRLYLAHCAQKLPQRNIGHLIISMNDMKTLLMNGELVASEEKTSGVLSGTRSSKLGLMEPAIEYVMKCLFKESREGSEDGLSELGNGIGRARGRLSMGEEGVGTTGVDRKRRKGGAVWDIRFEILCNNNLLTCNVYVKQLQIGDILMGLGLGRNQSELFGNSSCVSLVLHHLLRELPIGIVCSNALDILHLIECSNDYSFDQCLNYKLLGLRLCENISHVKEVNLVMKKVIQEVTGSSHGNNLLQKCKVVSRLNCLDEYLNVVDTHIDIVLPKHMNSYLDSILDGIFERTSDEEIGENELSSLQSILLKLLNHFDNLENILQLVDYGSEVEHHLAFLVQCRGAFGSMSEVKETIVHSSNLLVVKATRNDISDVNFVKSCIACSEVTIPSIPSHLKQLNLSLETAEVALMAGLVSHSDGLVDSALRCLHNVDLLEGLSMNSSSDGSVHIGGACSRMPKDVDGFQSTLCKFCSLIVMIPGQHPSQKKRTEDSMWVEILPEMLTQSGKLAGEAVLSKEAGTGWVSLWKSNIELGVTSIPRNMFSILSSLSWMLPSMKAKVLCALILTVSALSQNNLLYHAIHDEHLVLCARVLSDKVSKVRHVDILLSNLADTMVILLLGNNIFNGRGGKYKLNTICLDVWYGDTTLKEGFPNLFSVTSDKGWEFEEMETFFQRNVDYQVMGNDSLFFCDQQYLQELLSFSAVILQSLIDTVLQEPIQAARGNLALDACNAIASSFEVSHSSCFFLKSLTEGPHVLVCQGASDICSKLVETAKLSLSSNNKYLQSTIRFLNSRGLMQGESCKKAGD